MVFLHLAAPWSIAVFCIVKNRYNRTSSSLRCLIGRRRRWASMPKAVEPGVRAYFSRRTRWCGWLTSRRRLPHLDDSSALRPIYFCAVLSGRCLVYCTAASITAGVSCLVPQFEHSGAHTCSVLVRPPSLMVHFVGFYFTPNDASGSPPCYGM